MGDPELELGTVGSEEIDLDGGTKRRGRGAMAAVLLLLLLLCSITTISESYVRRGDTESVRGVLRNLRCLQCHTELIPDFSRESVHSPFELEHCTTCHTPHGEIHILTVYESAAQTWDRMRTLVEWLPLKVVFDVFVDGGSEGAEGSGGTVKSRRETAVAEAESQLVLPQDELCWMCHGTIGPQLSLEYPHEPFKVGHCTSCHNPHASNYGSLTRVDHRELCAGCHNISEEMSRSQIHPSFGSGDCMDCHHPHASEDEGILVDNQRDLCFSCHEGVAHQSGLAVQHDPFLNDRCTGCHEPHASDTQPLVIREQPDLCYMCHPQIEQDFLRLSHHPVDTLLECAGCHQPHASSYGGLLNAEGNQICYDCHEVVRPRYTRSGHEGQFCWGCHTPHGSDFGPLLASRQPEVCFPCHGRERFDDGSADYNNHPVSPIYYDVNRDTALSCTSTCHEPHGTPNNYMLRYYDSPLDGNCLLCHAATPGVTVGVDY